MRISSSVDSTAAVVADDWQALHLRCQLSHHRLTEPAKGSQCLHLPNCNFAVLLRFAGRTCPCCSARIARSRDVQLDKPLRSKLAALPAAVETVWICGDDIRLQPPPGSLSAGLAASSEKDAIALGDDGGASDAVKE